MGRGQIAWAALLGLSLVAGVGCAHSRPEPVKVTGTPEAVALVEKLKKVNNEPAMAYGTFVFETHQPRRARWAEWCYDGGSADVAEAILRGEPADSVNVRRYERKPQGKGWVMSEIWTEDGRPMVSQPPRPLIRGYPGDKEMVAGLWQVTQFGALASLAEGTVSLQRKMYRGEQCVVIRDEWASGTCRETYLSEKEGWLPRRIVVRGKMPSTRPAMPTQDMTCRVEWEKGTWPFKGRDVVIWKVPVAAFKEMDLDHCEIDSDTTVEKWVKRPDGTWLITEATTVWPFFRRTTQYHVENLSFRP